MTALCRYGLLRTAALIVMFAITGTMAAILSSSECELIYGASPVAWGCLVWLAVDTAARLTLLPWRRRAKLRRALMLHKNAASMALVAGAQRPRVLRCLRCSLSALSDSV